MEKIKIGKIVNVIGLRGEFKVFSYSGRPDRFSGYKQVIIAGETYRVSQVRIHKDMAIMKLDGVDDRDSAEALRGQEVLITERDLQKLPEGQYYIKDLVGLDVIDQNDKKIGILKDVLTNRAQDIFVIEDNEGREVMLPAVKEFIRSVDFRRGAVNVYIIEGIMGCYR